MESNKMINENRRKVLTLLGAVSTGSLAGCIGTGGSDEEATGIDGEMADSFEIWETTDESVYDEYIEEYSNETGTTIDHTNMGDDQQFERFQTRIVSGSGAPDTSLIQYTNMARVIDTNGLRDLQPWLEEAGVEDDFISGVMGTISRDDQIYALPEDIGPVGMFYRRDIFEEYGIDPDTIETWDQFIEEGEKLPDDYAMTSLPPNEYAMYWRTLNRQLGGQEFTSDGAITINSEESLRVLQLFKQMADANIISHDGSFTQSWFSRFEDGSTASYATGAWFTDSLEQTISGTSGQWGIMKLPAFEEGGRRASNWGGSGFVIPTQATDEAARRAWDFLQTYFTDPETQATSYTNYGRIPALKSAHDREELKSPREFFDGQQTGQLFVDVATDVPSYRYTPDSGEVEEAMGTIVRDVVQGGLQPEEAVERAAEQVANRTDREIA